MLGSATFTMDASSTTMNCATHKRINAVHLRSRYSCAVVIPDSFLWCGCSAAYRLPALLPASP